MTQTEISTRSTDRRIIALAIPALGALAVEPLYVLVDTAIVGRRGTPQLGGLALAATVLALVVNACTFLTYGTSERVARRIGAGDRAAAAEAGVQAIWLGAAVSIPLALAVGLGARPLTAALGGSDAVLYHATSYLRISALSVPAVVFILTAQGLQRGASDYRTPTYILIASNAFNAILEVVLVFGFDLGVPGSAWSTVIAQLLAAAVFAGVIRRHLRPASRTMPSWQETRPLVSAGRHLLLRSGSMLAVFVGATSIASRTDDPTLAAHQIAGSLLILVALALDALAIPAQTLVAEHLGAGDRSGAAAVGARVVRLTVYCAAAFGAILGLLALVLPRAFTADDAVVSRATAAIAILGLVLLIPGGIAYAYDGVLIGAGDYRFLGRAAFIYLAVLVPIGVVVVELGLGIAGVWLGLAAWMLLRSTVNHRRSLRLLPR